MLWGSKGAALTTLLGALFCFATPLLAQERIAVIDVARIMSESKRGRSVLAAIEQVQAEKRAELSVLQEQLVAVQKRFAEGRLSLAEDKLRDLQDEIELQTRDFERAREDAERAVNKIRAEDIQKVEDDVLPLINEVAKERGYSLVFQKYQSGLVYAAESIDITDIVLERFDQESDD